MHINPGGRLDPNEILGRDGEIQRYWDVLSRQSLIIGAERRIGKTSILQKMQHTGREGFVTFYQDLEGVNDTVGLVRSVYAAVGHALSLSGRACAAAAGAWATLVPKRIADIELPQARDNWKALLERVINDVLQKVGSGRLIVLMWDELPLMIHNLKRQCGPDTSIQLLNELRRLRQTNPTLRFLFTGSIGLHLVLRSLRLAGNANDPTNDMFADSVPPMAEAETIDLARRLLHRVKPHPDGIEILAVRIAKAVEGFPYYVQHVVDQLDQLGRAVTAEDVDNAVTSLLCADEDPAHFCYYVDRVATYYEPHEKPVALAILNAIAAEDNAVVMDNLINLVHHKDPAITEELVRSVVHLLRQDHYLTGLQHDGKQAYRFRWSLVQRWWRANRL